MAKEKYLSAHRAFRSSVLLFAATTVAVLQSMPQTLSVDQYRGLKKGVDDLTRLDAELAEFEAEITGEGVGDDQGDMTLDQSGPDVSDPAIRPARGGIKPAPAGRTSGPAVAAEADAQAEGASAAGGDPQAALNV